MHHANYWMEYCNIHNCNLVCNETLITTNEAGSLLYGHLSQLDWYLKISWNHYRLAIHYNQGQQGCGYVNHQGFWTVYHIQYKKTVGILVLSVIEGTWEVT